MFLIIIIFLEFSIKILIEIEINNWISNIWKKFGKPTPAFPNPLNVLSTDMKIPGS